MPNHCSNRVTISAHDGKEDQFKEVLKAFESERPFQSLYPQPDWPNIPNKDGVLPELREMKRPDGTVFTTTYYFPDGTNDDRWYDWCYKNWGTKWEAYDFHVADIDEECGYATFEFMTAWAPADGIYNVITEKYPDVGISWFYDEPGCELAGYLPD